MRDRVNLRSSKSHQEGCDGGSEHHSNHTGCKKETFVGKRGQGQRREAIGRNVW